MRPGTDAGIIAVSPVSEIVVALLPAAGVIADFVGWYPGTGRHGVGQLVERRGDVGVERLELALRRLGRKARARLYRQLVQREVRGAESERLSESCRPTRLGVARKRVNQVEADAAEVFLRGLEGAKAFA